MVKLGIFVAKPLMIAYLAVFFVFWFFCEGYFQRFIRQETPYMETHRVITQGELYSRIEGGE
jgi:hypothetical protein